MPTPIADFPYVQLATFPALVQRFQQQTGLSVRLVLADMGMMVRIGEIIEVFWSDEPETALWRLNAVENGLIIGAELPFRTTWAVATIAAGLERVAADLKTGRRWGGGQGVAVSGPVVGLKLAQSTLTTDEDPAVEFTIGELEAILSWTKGGPFHVTIETDHEELPEVAEFYRPGEDETAYLAVKRAPGTVEVTECYTLARQREGNAVVADVSAALAWIEARESWGGGLVGDMV